MIAIDFFEFIPKEASDPDTACIAKFNFEIYGILFRSWKIRCKDGIHYSISPPYVRHLGERTDIVFFTYKEDFVHITRSVIQTAKENGIIKQNKSNRRYAARRREDGE